VTITLRNRNGDEVGSAEGKAFGTFVAHRKPGTTRGAWLVTHAPSGLLITMNEYPNRREAELVARACARLEAHYGILEHDRLYSPGMRALRQLVEALHHRPDEKLVVYGRIGPRLLHIPIRSEWLEGVVAKLLH
jgi:hypothetical protein